MMQPMNGRGWQRMALVVAVCALVGALAGIAGSAAAPSSKSKSSAAAKAAKKHEFRQMKRAFRRGGFALRFGPGPRGLMGGPIHDEAVVPKPDGSGFMTITMDGGTLLSVDGNTLHLKQAVGNNVYKDDAAITVGSNVKVIRDRKDASLSDLKAGDHVRVITGAPKGDFVIAADDAFLKQMRQEHHGFDHHGFGPGGPPPAGPDGAPGMYPGGQMPGGSTTNG